MNQDIKKLKTRYKGEWMAIKQGKVVAHDPDRRKLHEEVRKKKLKGVYITFSGPIVKPGYEVILISFLPLLSRVGSIASGR